MVITSKWHWIFLVTLGAVLLLVPLKVGAAHPQERTFHVQASSYQYTPAVIRVNPGDRVTIDLQSTDVVHGLYVDGYGVSQTVDPGQTARLSFIAGRVGTFRLRCSVTCGPLHPFMTGKLVVGRNTLLWRAAGLAILALAGVFSSTLKRPAESQMVDG